MPIVTDDVRKLATVEIIAAINPIDGADAIERATVRGWNVVIRKGEFAVGDLVVFFEVDTALPLADDRFAFLASRGTKTVDGEQFHILKTARLRGVYSQGLVLPAEDFVFGWIEPGTDVTVALGLGKWEAPMPDGGDEAGPFLAEFARKTASERTQNIASSWDAVAAHQWQASEKVDGISMTVARDMNGNLRVCGRKWEIGDGDNVYWRAVRSNPDLFAAVPVGGAVQCEVAGPGLHGNRLGLADVTVFVFDVLLYRATVPRDQWPDAVLAHAAPPVDLPFPDSAEHAVAQVEGLRSVVAPGKQAEGVVWHTTDGTAVPELGYRPTFKAINNKYLAKFGG